VGWNDALDLVAGAERVLLHLDGVIPKPRVFSSGARDLAREVKARSYNARSFAPPEKRLRSG